MSFSHWITVAVVAFLPLIATAQQSQQPSPTDPTATVPPVGYVSAFDNYRATPEQKTSPDQVWRTANEEITSQDMHGGHAAMPGMGPAASGKSMAMPGMGAGMGPAPSGKHMSMPGMEPGTSGSHMSMHGMGPAKPETKAAMPKTDRPVAHPHAGHHNMQGK